MAAMASAWLSFQVTPRLRWLARLAGGLRGQPGPRRSPPRAAVDRRYRTRSCLASRSSPAALSRRLTRPARLVRSCEPLHGDREQNASICHRDHGLAVGRLGQRQRERDGNPAPQPTPGQYVRGVAIEPRVQRGVSTREPQNEPRQQDVQLALKADRCRDRGRSPHRPARVQPRGTQPLCTYWRWNCIRRSMGPLLWAPL